MNKRTKWFEKARFGMFIHWGVYSSIGRGEWVRSIERISDEDYQPYVEGFQPASFDASSMAKLAKKAGIQYAVFTAKHHDGYCLFDTDYTTYSSAHYCNRDFVREYVEAFRNEGIRIGLYYSLIDWHHPDFPHYGDRNHPDRDNEAFKNYRYDFSNYLKYMHGQIRELCTNYGKIDILWTDYSYDDLKCEAWHGTELVNMIRSLQPDIILNNRLEASGEGFGSLITSHPNITSGDFVSPEQIIPPQGIRNENGEHVPWEACITMNRNWGYHKEDHDYKSSLLLIRKLVECVSKDGNMILNIGPDGNGNIPEEAVKRLTDIGRWMEKNSESIYACGYSGLPKPENGRITRKKNTYYYHIFEPDVGAIPLYGVQKNQIDEIRLLYDGKIIDVSDTWITNNYPDIVFADLGSSPDLPDPIDTVIKVTCKGD